MKKRITILSTFIFVFFCLTLVVNAETKYVMFNDTVRIRKGPGTTYEILTTNNVGTTYYLKNFNLVADEAKDGTCDSGWYEINYNGEPGYVCSDYVSLYTVNESDNQVATTVCEKEMEAAGFPSSYWSGLCSLKEKHSNWTFKAIQTGLDWNTAVNKFTNCGDSLVANPKEEWLDKTCTYKEGAFRAVNQKGVANYLDPRNFFTEKYIFQFEDNRYNVGLQNNYYNISKGIISSTSFYKYHIGVGNDLANMVSVGGKESNVSPTHLASRMYQELGVNERLKNLYQGIFYGEIGYAPINPKTGTHLYDFRGYYNFYNIGVTGYCVTGGGGATYCGLNKAISYGWDTVQKAVTGGGNFLTSNYINLGQYTSYLERFNVVPTDSRYMYVHYYMANLTAPSSEATIAYNSYKNNDVLNSPFVFSIPVYSNMGATIVPEESGAVDNGSESSPSTIEIGTIITSAGFKLLGSYIMGISPNTDASKIITSMESVGGTASIKDRNNAEVKSGNVGTGYTITIKNAKESKTYTIVIKGDASGDGVINAQDLIYTQRHILGSYTLRDAYLKAADASNDNIVNAQDLIYIQRHILGTYTIVQ